MRGSRLSVLLATAVVVAVSGQALAVCCPVSPPIYQLTSVSQLTLVMMEQGYVTLIPNIVIGGDAADFALLVPTPAVPTLSPVDKDLWTDALQVTAVMSRQRNGYDAGCADATPVYLADGEASDAAAAVDVISRETVGAFIATILRADDATSLLDWLTDNGYAFTGEEAAIFQDFIDEGWVFTAMKLDPDAPGGQVPPEGWDHAVDPVALRYEADHFDVALPVASIHREPWMPMRFFVIDDHRMDLAGFTTTYANHLNAAEMRAIQSSYPDLAAYLAPGRFLVQLDRIFSSNDAMDDVLRLHRAASDDEVLPTGGGFWGAVPWSLLPLGGVWLGRRRRRPRASRT